MKMRNAYKIVVRKLEGKQPIGCKWENNNKVDQRE
jgi:hypothetical protein